MTASLKSKVEVLHLSFRRVGLSIMCEFPWRGLRSVLALPALASACLLAGTAGAQQLSLHQAITDALHSPQAMSMAAVTGEAEGQLKEASLGLNPRLFLQSEDWRPWGDHFDFGTQTENYAFLSQTFETDGKRRKRVAVASARLDEARAQQQAARVALVSRVAASYWKAVELKQVATLLQEDMGAVDGMVQYDQARVSEGAMRGVDLLRMKIERDRLLLALRTAEREAAQARLELFKQIGRPPMETLELSDRLESTAPVPPQPMAEVLAKRPDLEAARQAIRVAEADVTLQHAVGVPNLDLVGGYKRNDQYNTGYSALQFDLPFHNRNQGEVERARASLRFAQSSYQALELRARAEIAQSEQAYKEQEEIVNSVLPTMRSNARENLRLLTEAFRLGGVDLLRFLDAERTEFEVEVSALRARAELQQAGLQLRLSYGEQP